MLPKTTYAYYVWNYGQRGFLWVTGEKQRRPYNLFCAMQNELVYFTRNDGTLKTLYPGLVSNFDAEAGNASIKTEVENLSYKRMVDSLGDASSLGATLTAERRETWNTVVGLVTRCLSAARNIKKLKFADAARELGIPYHERTVVRRVRTPGTRNHYRKVRQQRFSFGDGRERVKSAANGWLMYSYGVKPLAQDIYNAMDLLQRPFPWTRIKGSGTRKSSRTVRSASGPSGRISNVRTWTAITSVSQSVEVAVDNPNLWLMNRLGLVNPAQWILEGIPLSFVVDWFSNLSDVISSMTDFVGLVTQRPCYNYRNVRVYDFWSLNYLDQYVEQDYSWTNVRYGRLTTNLGVPKLRFAYERFSWQRGLNAISLLVGMLKSSSGKK